jgi:hypothetical protein
MGTRHAIVIPASALVREGDLTGVQVTSPSGSELRWVKIGPLGADSSVEVLSGLAAGDVILDGSR